MRLLGFFLCQMDDEPEDETDFTDFSESAGLLARISRAELAMAGKLFRLDWDLGTCKCGCALIVACSTDCRRRDGDCNGVDCSYGIDLKVEAGLIASEGLSTIFLTGSGGTDSWRLVSGPIEELTEYILEGTRTKVSRIDVGASFGGTFGPSFLNDRFERIELYPLSAFARGLISSSRVSLAGPPSYAESKERGIRGVPSRLGVSSSAANKSSSIAVFLLVDSNLGDGRGESSKENGLNGLDAISCWYSNARSSDFVGE